MTLPPSPPSAAGMVPPRLWPAAMRAGFLTITAVGWLLGTVLAAVTGSPLDPVNAALALFGALAAHAGANAVNDAADADGDAGNKDRISPFTGGSQLIQQGRVTPAAMLRFALLWFVVAIACGLALLARGPSGLLGFGLAGLALAWTYSMPPLRLMARGVGELAVALGWALVVAGSAYVQRPEIDASIALAAAGFGLAVATILLINGFPDLRADAAAGKRTLVVRLGRRGGTRAYALVAGMMYTVAICTAVIDDNPLLYVVLLAAPASWQAVRLLRDNGRHAPRPPSLRLAIQFTLLAAHAYGLLWAAAVLIVAAAAAATP